MRPGAVVRRHAGTIHLQQVMTVSTDPSVLSTSTLECGATLVTERVPGVASVALNWLLPLGSATDPANGDGLAPMLSELIFRGAGSLNSREHSDALDRLGVQRHSDVATHHLHLRMTLLGSHLPKAIPLATDMIRRPALPDSALEPVRSLSLQSLGSLDDDPQHMVMLRLREQHQPPPFNRHGYGDQRVLESATIEQLRDAWVKRCVPNGAIFAFAGDVDHDAVASQLNELLTKWSGNHVEPQPLAAATRGKLHLPQDTAQVHIALAYDAPSEPDESSMLERLATRVLSGSTSGRLFTEVRQKRSLCYSVGATYRAGRDMGHVSLYAGTTPERAQETLDVCRAEIGRLREGARPDEFHRAVTGLKSQMVMSGESTAARAGALGYDQFRLGRPRSLQEVADAIDSITLEQLNAYLAQRDFGDFTIVSIGPAELS